MEPKTIYILKGYSEDNKNSIKDADSWKRISAVGKNGNDIYRKPFIYLKGIVKIIKILLKMRIRGSELVQWEKMEMTYTEEILCALRLDCKGGTKCLLR